MTRCDARQGRAAPQAHPVPSRRAARCPPDRDCLRLGRTRIAIYPYGQCRPP
jgi:hypothetical protein